MTNFSRLVFFLILSAASLTAYGAENDCQNPRPIFGKILATCGDQMITYIGDQKVKVLGVNSTLSRFELAYCYGGGGRKDLYLQTNSEGYEFTYTDPYNKDLKKRETYRISKMWGEFLMVGVGYNGEEVKVTCNPYDDKRTDIEYIYR